eukprot:Rmarinus@m.6231
MSFTPLVRRIIHNCLSRDRRRSFSPQNKAPYSPTSALKGLHSGVEATVLMTHRADVQRMNTRRLGSLRGEAFLFTARDSVPTHMSKTLDSFSNVQKELELKVGALVILLKNVDVARGLVKGCRGVIQDFAAPPQNRLTPSMRVTIVQNDRCGASESGGASEGGDREKVCNSYGGFGTGRSEGRGSGETKVLAPVVAFENGLTEMVLPTTWELTSGDRVVASRVQVPLDHAWALSIHRCQGMTLDNVEISLAR